MVVIPLAGCQALWELVHAGIFLMGSSSVTVFEPVLDWTTVYATSGGQSAGWQFKSFTSSYPTHVLPSLVSDNRQVFADPDLYLSRISIPEWDIEIGKALRDSISCFRNELFAPTLVMLGKASEGAWIELGTSLAAFVGLNEPKVQKFSQSLTGTDTGFAKKLRDIVSFFETRDVVSKDLCRKAGVTLHDLRMAVLWSESLREIRNTIHHGVRAFAEPTYETAVNLLISGIPNLRALYTLYSAAIEGRTGQAV